MPNLYLLIYVIHNINIYITYVPKDFVMVYIRKKKVKGHSYYYIVEGIYDDQRKVKQKVVRYLGSIKSIIEKFDFWEENH